MSLPYKEININMKCKEHKKLFKYLQIQVADNCLLPLLSLFLFFQRNRSTIFDT